MDAKSKQWYKITNSYDVIFSLKLLEQPYKGWVFFPVFLCSSCTATAKVMSPCHGLKCDNFLLQFLKKSNKIPQAALRYFTW